MEEAIQSAVNTESVGGKSLFTGQVSVVIPAYNVGKYIGRTIESVLRQKRSADEIIVVDDGSSDETAIVVKQYGDRVRYIYQENGGASVARNTGIEAARFDWIALLDGDDEWLEDKLALQTEHLGRNPELVWTTANFYLCLCDEDRRGLSIEAKLGERALGGKEYFDDFFDNPLPHGCGWTGTMLIRKKVLEEAGMFRPGQLMANDLDMWWRIAYRWGQIGFISEPLAIYHMTIPQSITQKYNRLDIRRELIKRHLKLAEEQGRLDVFKPCMAKMVTSWIRTVLFENRPRDIRIIMDDFDELLTARFKTIIGLLLIFPPVTARLCHTISRVVRVLHLSRGVMRRPGKATNKLQD